MRKIISIATLDGKVHPDETSARKHISLTIENRIGAIVDQLRNKNRFEMWDILHNNLHEFAALYDLSKDAETIEDSDEF